MQFDLEIWQAIVVALTPFAVLVFVAFVRELFELTVHFSFCIMMVLCIVFAVVMI